MNKYRLILIIGAIIATVYDLLFSTNITDCVFAVAGVYLVCGQYEDCCDTAGTGGVCCPQCKACSGGNCNSNKADNTPCSTAEPNSVCCSGTCSGLNDSSNCGACGVTCDFDQVCSGGVCIQA